MSIAPLLTVTRDHRPVTEAEVRGVVTIGRHPQNTIILDDKGVSRWHALLFLDTRGHSHLQDLGSSNAQSRPRTPRLRTAASVASIAVG